ncbi:uncharacterized protein PRCAT00001969001 [Priceomyces carsonii]|uniref:uncharacterized protein n=1 Tax=Priceomyces carsonii TaxID=28549 RepID=UPI002ED9A81E|nr:unnamed protein product [Priceomyces carsonii]
MRRLLIPSLAYSYKYPLGNQLPIGRLCSLTATLQVTSKQLLSTRSNVVKDNSDDKNKIQKNKSGIRLDSIYVISLPITSNKSYIHCNHRPSILPKSQLKAFPLVTKLENKISGLVLKGWNKMNNSKFRVNVKLTDWVKMLLNTIQYEEGCLRSFPSKNSMIREVNHEFLNEKKLSSPSLVQTQISSLKIPESQLKPIPLFYPEFQDPMTILKQLRYLRDTSYSKHFKQAIICAVGLPLTLPLALIPILPNVPGFYVAYRLYCNIKAIYGSKHLGYLLDDTDHRPKENSSSEKKPASDTDHITFTASPILDKIYRTYGPAEIVTSNDKKERIVINTDIIDALGTELPLAHLKADLLKALRQETARLEKLDKAIETIEN